LTAASQTHSYSTAEQGTENSTLRSEDGEAEQQRYPSHRLKSPQSNIQNLLWSKKSNAGSASAESIRRLTEAFKAASLAAGRVGAHDPKHLATANAAQALAKAYRDLGNPDVALDYYRRALTIMEAELGDTHPKTLNTVENIAATLADQSEFGEALSYLQRSLAGREATVGRDHPSSLALLKKIAQMHRSLDQNEEALQQFSEAWSKYSDTLGKCHLSTITVLAEIAATHHKLGRDDEALTAYRRVLEVREMRLGSDHVLTQEIRNAIASITPSTNDDSGQPDSHGGLHGEDQPRPSDAQGKYVSIYELGKVS